MPVSPRAGENITLRHHQRNLQKWGIRAREVYEAALVQLSGTFLLPRPEQAEFDQEDVLSVLVYAAATASSVEQAGRTLQNAPSPNTVRQTLSPLCLDAVEAQFNEALVTPGVRQVLRSAFELAVDLKEVPFYGQAKEDEADFVWKGRARMGTTHFFVYASAYVIQKGQRVTLALHACRRSEGLIGALKRLLERVRCLGGQVSCLYLDREFYQVEVLSFLQQEVDIPLCMAAPQKGTEDGTGLKALVLEAVPGLYPHTVRSPKHGGVEVTVAVVGHYLQGRWGKHKRVRYTYVVHRFPWAFAAISPKYRHRFGIESSYRIEEQARARTTAKSALLRFLWVALALVLQNLWVWLQWACVSVARKGGRLILGRYFTFFRMLTFLRRALEVQYRVIEQVCLYTTAPG